jgi:hypothetical protein
VLVRNVIEEQQERRATPEVAVANLAIALAADPLPFLDTALAHGAGEAAQQALRSVASSAAAVQGP